MLDCMYSIGLFHTSPWKWGIQSDTEKIENLTLFSRNIVYSLWEGLSVAVLFNPIKGVLASI